MLACSTGDSCCLVQADVKVGAACVSLQCLAQAQSTAPQGLLPQLAALSMTGSPREEQAGLMA